MLCWRGCRGWWRRSPSLSPARPRRLHWNMTGRRSGRRRSPSLPWRLRSSYHSKWPAPRSWGTAGPLLTRSLALSHWGRCGCGPDLWRGLVWGPTLHTLALCRARTRSQRLALGLELALLVRTDSRALQPCRADTRLVTSHPDSQVDRLLSGQGNCRGWTQSQEVSDWRLYSRNPQRGTPMRIYRGFPRPLSFVERKRQRFPQTVILTRQIWIQKYFSSATIKNCFISKELGQISTKFIIFWMWVFSKNLKILSWTLKNVATRCKVYYFSQKLNWILSGNNWKAFIKKNSSKLCIDKNWIL